jgi:hypothetical protein
MADGKWQKGPGKAKAKQDSKYSDARSVERTERWHFAGLGHSELQSRQYAGAPASVRLNALERAGPLVPAWPHIR